MCLILFTRSHFIQLWHCRKAIVLRITRFRFCLKHSHMYFACPLTTTAHIYWQFVDANTQLNELTLFYTFNCGNWTWILGARLCIQLWKMYPFLIPAYMVHQSRSSEINIYLLYLEYQSPCNLIPDRSEMCYCMNNYGLQQIREDHRWNILLICIIHWKIKQTNTICKPSRIVVYQHSQRQRTTFQQSEGKAQ